ncbi:MAG: aminoglycoside phosphotransferase family protein [Chloroflexota bacterium]
MADWIEQVKRHYSRPIEEIHVIKSGWSNVVVEVNRNIVFRFPRKILPQFEVEKAFLADFKSDVATPRPILSGPDFIAYNRIPGERFDPQKFLLLDSTNQQYILRQLGQFLTQLHSSQFSHPHLSENEYGSATFWEETWPLVSPWLKPKTQQKAQVYFEGYFEFTRAYPLTKSIIHGDLGTNNLLVDFDQAKLTGIIDFSDMCIGDPASDFAGFARHFGHEFVNHLIELYERPAGQHFWQRISYSNMRKRFFIVYFAHHNGFAEHIPSIIQLIEKEFEEIHP